MDTLTLDGTRVSHIRNVPASVRHLVILNQDSLDAEDLSDCLMSLNVARAQIENPMSLKELDHLATLRIGAPSPQILVSLPNGIHSLAIEEAPPTLAGLSMPAELRELFLHGWNIKGVDNLRHHGNSHIDHRSQQRRVQDSETTRKVVDRIRQLVDGRARADGPTLPT